MTGQLTRRNPADFPEYPCFPHPRYAGGERSLSSLWQLFNGVPAQASPVPHVPDSLFRNRE